MTIVLSVLIGFCLDCLFGDPANLWHPICAIGKLISKTEALLRRIFPPTPNALLIAGILLWFIVCGLSFLIPLIVLYLLSRIHPALAFIANTFFCYQIFARKCLADAGKDVYTALARSLDDGRKAVSMYVGRDTQALDETGVIKATVETIAENTTDGVIAPMIFMLIGGAPLGFLYKAVNTLDSMVGYHNDKYEYFGRFSAKVDDVFNFIPARISAICMIAAAGMLILIIAMHCASFDGIAKIIRVQIPHRLNLYVPVHCISSLQGMPCTSVRKWKSRSSVTLIDRSRAMISPMQNDS